MSRQKRVHKSLKIGAPPLRQRIAYFPVFVYAFTTELGADGGQTFVQSGFEAGDFVVVMVEVISWSVAPNKTFSSVFCVVQGIM